MADFHNYDLHYARMGNDPTDYKSISDNIEEYICHEAWLPEDKEIAILDVGCGWGTLLLRLWATGYRRLTGIDISQGQCDIAIKRLPPDVTVYCGNTIEFLKNNVGSYDLITILDVIEHLSVDNAIELLQNCNLALRENGMIVVKVPNMSNILSNYSRYLDITHLTGYTEWSLFQLLDCGGFHQHEVIKPSFGSFEIWKRTRSWKAPLAGLGFREALNGWIHQIFYALRGMRPKPSVFGGNLTIRSFRK